VQQIPMLLRRQLSKLARSREATCWLRYLAVTLGRLQLLLHRLL
jgi:hypothetical protein